jgi:predicted acylesterase/phospholipase RssA
MEQDHLADLALEEMGEQTLKNIVESMRALARQGAGDALVARKALASKILVDFDRLNPGEVRVSVGAVNVRSGNLANFDTAERRLEPRHFMAFGALPPGFPAIEIDGEYYWDGGVVSNTPLSHVLSSEPRRDMPFASASE